MEYVALSAIAGFVAGMLGAQSVIWSWRRALKRKVARRA